MSGAYCKHGVRVEDTHPDMVSRCWKCEPATLEEFNEVVAECDAALAQAREYLARADRLASENAAALAKLAEVTRERDEANARAHGYERAADAFQRQLANSARPRALAESQAREAELRDCVEMAETLVAVINAYAKDVTEDARAANERLLAKFRAALAAPADETALREAIAKALEETGKTQGFTKAQIEAAASSKPDKEITSYEYTLRCHLAAWLTEAGWKRGEALREFGVKCINKATGARSDFRCVESEAIVDAVLRGER